MAASVSSALSADQIVDRRKMKRRITFWRIASLLLLAAAIASILWALGAFEGLSKRSSDHIARVKISGVITNDKPMLDLLEDLKEKEQVKAVILDISSPGGSTVGGEAIFEAVRDLAAEKPVASSVGTLAASAGYMIAAGSDHIVARRSSIVGSIGVIFQYGQVSELLDKIGVEVNEIKSSPLKAEPSPFKPASPEAKAMIDRIVQDSYQWFVGLVADRRGFTPSKARLLADGSIFTGAQGLENGLVDEIGDEETARAWLVAEKGLSDSLEIHTWKADRDNDLYLSNPAGKTAAALRWFAVQLGLATPAAPLGELYEMLPERLFLDGLVSMLQIDGAGTLGR
ncbi:signal peptide peptidase SppA [Salaquimonas pukyongi]|uniref:signal peptide peptidase SppA n=1 Tax=Salaquimonas pukyongi TaxID=2712698 RepID=UPI00096B9B5F|nr:signal peptide peptidase SppA [Salaquimonas pukyongi]